MYLINHHVLAVLKLQIITDRKSLQKLYIYLHTHEDFINVSMYLCTVQASEKVQVVLARY